MILFFPHKLAFDNLIALVPHEPVQWLNNGLEIEAFRYWIHPILTIRTSIIVVGALEDEA